MTKSRLPEVDVVVFEDCDDSYMLAADALSLYGPEFGSIYTAKQIIGDALRSGKMDCFADEYWITDVGDVALDEWNVPHRPQSHLTDITIGADLFRSSRQWPEDFSLWKWDSSEFVIFLEEDQPYGRVQRAHLKGVRLPVSIVESLIELNTGSRPRSRSREGIGGRPIRTAEWTRFWHAVLKFAVEHRLNDFETQKELRAAILEEINDVLKEETIVEPTRQIWQKFVRKQDYT